MSFVLVPRTTSDYKTGLAVTLTDRNGKFRLPRVSTGTYYLRFRFPGPMTFSIEVERSGSFGPLRVRLEISN